MSFSNIIDKIIPDGSKIDEFSKSYLNDSEKKDIESLYLLSIFGIFLPLMSPIIYYAVKRRKESALAIIIVLSSIILSSLSLFLWNFGGFGLITLVNLAIITVWVRGIYIFVTEFLPMKKEIESTLEQQNKESLKSIIYEPNKNKE